MDVYNWGRLQPSHWFQRVIDACTLPYRNAGDGTSSPCDLGDPTANPDEHGDRDLNNGDPMSEGCGNEGDALRGSATAAGHDAASDEHVCRCSPGACGVPMGGMR
jgi:hypothetical protein